MPSTSRSALVSVLAVTLLVASQRVARADEPAPAAPRPASPWYGYQTLTADGASLAAAIASATTGAATPTSPRSSAWPASAARPATMSAPPEIALVTR